MSLRLPGTTYGPSCFPTSSDLLVPTSPSSKSLYRLIEPIGRGSRSEVFKAIRDDGAYVAVKRMFTKEQLRGIDGSFDSRGVSLEPEREYFNSRLLDHPYIVRAFDTYEAFDSEGVLRSHVVLEWVNGIPLSAVPHGSIPKQQSLQNLQMLFKALIFAYQQGLVHLDLHGKNIMMDAMQEIKLIDLGSFASLESQAHSLQTLSDRLNDVLDVCDEILRTGNWAEGEAYRVSWSLASLVQTPEAAQYCCASLSQETVGALVEFLSSMDRELSSLSF